VIDKSTFKALAESDPLWRIFRGVEKHLMLTDGSAVSDSRGLAKAFASFSKGIGRDQETNWEENAPRRACVAMALAVYSQPHLAVTFRRQTVEGEPDEPALVLQTYTMEKALTLPQWELDDIRECVDVRVGKTLKQARALHWLWTRFGLPKSNPEPMFRVLIPGAKSKLGPVGLVRRGPQLYAVVQQKFPPPVRSLFMNWLPLDHERSFSPLHTFQAKYVDKNLRKAMTRSIGCSDEELCDILDGMITVIPRKGSTTFLRHDHWRSRAISAMTGLAHPYSVATWLTDPLTTNDINWKPWLSANNGELRIESPAEVFDVLLLPRARAMMRQLYAQLLAQLELENVRRDEDGQIISSVDDVHIYNTAGHLRHISQPLFDWVKSEQVRADIGRALEVSQTKVDDAFDALEVDWRNHFQSIWARTGGHELDGNVQARITRHLIALHTSVRRAYHREPTDDWDHRDFVMLFAAHYLAHVPVESLWSDNSPHTEDMDRYLGDVFWGLWTKLLRTTAEETLSDL
jgi:hypothetical protein